jgi:hypothetical protein
MNQSSQNKMNDVCTDRTYRIYLNEMDKKVASDLKIDHDFSDSVYLAIKAIVLEKVLDGLLS